MFDPDSGNDYLSHVVGEEEMVSEEDDAGEELSQAGLVLVRRQQLLQPHLLQIQAGHLQALQDITDECCLLYIGIGKTFLSIVLCSTLFLWKKNGW